MSLNAPSEAKLRGVKPDLARVARRASELTTQPFQIVQGNRTQAEQNAIYSQGRTRPGPIVTWTKNSKHIGGGAIDFAALVNGKINWDSKYYPPIAAAFKKAADESGVGIAWGGDWKTKDWGHIQLIAGAMARLPSQEQQNAGSIPAARSTLKQGMSGGDVPVLQNRLKALGDYKGLSGVPFNSELLSAVKAFQKRTKLVQDGIVGPKTWSKLYDAGTLPILQPGSSSNGPHDTVVLSDKSAEAEGLSQEVRPPLTMVSSGLSGMQLPTSELHVPDNGGQDEISVGETGSEGHRSPQNPVSASGDRFTSPDAKLATGASLRASEPIGEQTGNLTVPEHAVTYLEARGWSHLASVALVAGLLWESGGNSKWKLNPLAIGDGGKSHGAGQWNDNGSRYHDLLEFAHDRGTSSGDMETQLAFVDHELHTTERRAAAALKVAQTIETANQAAITYWRPSIPHATKRLDIAKKLMG